MITTLRFEHLRTTPWSPTFTWMPTVEEAADRINVWHEDYPERVYRTIEAIKDNAHVASTGVQYIDDYRLRTAHRQMFKEPWAGQFRKIDVRVGPHNPPRHGKVATLMQDLFRAYSFKKVADIDIGFLKAWYTDFETIHPFQDGNGRVGGVIVAAYSHALHPEKGWLAPNQ